jgi:hypothetical protein
MTGSNRLEAAMSLFSLPGKPESVYRIKFIGREDRGISPEKSKQGGHGVLVKSVPRLRGEKK